MRISNIFLPFLMCSFVFAQKAELTNDDLKQAIEYGAQHKKDFMGLQLHGGGKIFTPTFGGYHAIVYTPIAWIRNLSANAAKEFRTLNVSDISQTDKAPVLRVVIYPNQPSQMNQPCTSVTHAVIRDSSKQKVIQPSKKDAFEDTASNAFGAKRTCEGVSEEFDMADIAPLIQRGEEFYLTIAGANEGDIKIKPKDLSKLP